MSADGYFIILFWSFKRDVEIVDMCHEEHKGN